jgi:hypothetical protein
MALNEGSARDDRRRCVDTGGWVGGGGATGFRLNARSAEGKKNCGGWELNADKELAVRL